MSQTSTLKGQCIAEFLGTGLLIFFGVGCVAALKSGGSYLWPVGNQYHLGSGRGNGHLPDRRGFPARILTRQLPLHCGSSRVLTDVKLFRLLFLSLPARFARLHLFTGFTTIFSSTLGTNAQYGARQC